MRCNLALLGFGVLGWAATDFVLLSHMDEGVGYSWADAVEKGFPSPAKVCLGELAQVGEQGTRVLQTECPDIRGSAPRSFQRPSIPHHIIA